jgi:hypothetical protein
VLAGAALTGLGMLAFAGMGLFRRKDDPTGAVVS